MSGPQPSAPTRSRIGRDEVFAAAEELVDQVGWDGLTMSSLATKLGVKAPSLYHHVNGLDSLRAELQVRAMVDMGQAILEASAGRSGAEGVRDQAHAQRRFALNYPYRYEGMTRAAIDTERMRVAGRTSAEASTRMVMSAGVGEEEAWDLVRALFAAHHGFVVLEISGFFPVDVDMDEVFESVLDNSVRSVVAAAAAAGGAP